MPKGIRGFQKGNQLGKGRILGSKNKFTSLKQAFIDAFNAIGGEQALIDWVANDAVVEYIDKKSGKKVKIDLGGDRKKEFFKMISSMLPKELAVTGADGGSINVLIEEARKRVTDKDDESK